MSKPSWSLRELVLVVGLVLAGAPAATAQVTLFTVPTANSSPSAIAAGPDGNLWFAEQSGNKIGRMTPAGSFTEFPIPSANAAPFAITAGPDGTLWFTEAGTDKIGRITTSGAISEFPLPRSQSGPTGIVTGVDGALWFAEDGGNGNKIGRITTSGSITEFAIPTASAGPFAIAAGPDGALWFAEAFVGKIGRIAIDGTITEYAIPTANSQPTGIAVGPDGNLWFTEEAANKIGSITVTGTISEFAAPNSVPFGIVAGPDQALWFTETGSNAVGHITTDPTVTEVPLGSGCSPSGLSFGADGKLYVTCTTGNAIGQYTLPAVVTLTVVADDLTTGFGLVTSRPEPIRCEINPGVGLGGQSGVCTATARRGTPATLTAAAHLGSIGGGVFVDSTFAGWTEGCSGTGQCSLVLNSDTTVAAKFTSLPHGSDGSVNVQVIRDDDSGATGRVVSTPSGIDCPSLCEAYFPIGTAVTLTPVPSSTAAFKGWFSAEICQGFGTAPCTVTVTSTSEVGVGAHFASGLTFDQNNSAILPVSRSVSLGSGAQSTVTVFGTLINASSVTATKCAVQPPSLEDQAAYEAVADFAGSFTYQTTNPTTNALSGTANTPVDIPAGGSQSFVLAFTPTLPFPPIQLPLIFACANTGAAPIVPGLNTVLLSASSTTAIADVIAVGATPSGDQIVHIRGNAGSNAFVVATDNLGGAAVITVTADTGTSNIPVTILLCQTNSQTGQCLAPPSTSVTTQINSGATPTFGFFITATDGVQFDPANNRVFVRFFDPTGAQRGGTSFAVKTE